MSPVFEYTDEGGSRYRPILLLCWNLPGADPIPHDEGPLRVSLNITSTTVLFGVEDDVQSMILLDPRLCEYRRSGCHTRGRGTL